MIVVVQFGEPLSPILCHSPSGSNPLPRLGVDRHVLRRDGRLGVQQHLRGRDAALVHGPRSDPLQGYRLRRGRRPIRRRLRQRWLRLEPVGCPPYPPPSRY